MRSTTPKHGSWLNIAEIELSVLARRLKERWGNATERTRQIAVIEQDRDAATKGADWQFTTDQARINLKRRYPSIEMRTSNSSCAGGLPG